MFNPLKMAGDLKNIEKMLKPALEKFMNESGFVKQEAVSYTHLTLPTSR